MYMAIMKATNATMHVCREALAIANFWISGTAYRIIGPPRNAHNAQPLQTYFYDPDEQLKYRIQRHQAPAENADLEKTILNSLLQVLQQAPNTYLQSFLNNIQELNDKGQNARKWLRIYLRW
jgi:hypothetical protein